MEKEVRILILDDERTDIELIRRELNRVGLNFNLKQAKSKEEFIASLSEFAPHLIIADYSFPLFDGLSALTLAKKQCPEIPFLLVADSLGEGAAVETLKRGAADYILKHQLSLLGPAVHRALLEVGDHKEQKRMEDLKGELLDILSHELRIPISVIQESMSLLSDGTLGETTPEQSKFLKMSLDGMKRLARIFEKLLLATRATVRKLECSFQPLDLVEIVKASVEGLKSVAESKGVKLRVIGAEQPIPSMGDHKLLTEALNQTLENAIQATPQGGMVTVSCSKKQNEAEISMKDMGAGIPEEELGAVFERFHAVGGVNDRKTGGLSLGLFIVRSILEAHRGDVSIASARGTGTCVTFKIPLPPKSIP